jgi:hypothetical protein
MPDSLERGTFVKLTEDVEKFSAGLLRLQNIFVEKGNEFSKLMEVKNIIHEDHAPSREDALGGLEGREVPHILVARIFQNLLVDLAHGFLFPLKKLDKIVANLDEHPGDFSFLVISKRAG